MKINGTIPIKNEAVSVPCGTCTLCCKRTLVLILPEMGDDASSYKTITGVPDKGGEPRKFLAMKPNHDCIYLGESGCTIHGRAPYMCRIFDCREQHAQYTRDQRREMIRQGKLSKDVLARGNFLLRQQS